jgi:hypothetical protein
VIVCRRGNGRNGHQLPKSPSRTTDRTNSSRTTITTAAQHGTVITEAVSQLGNVMSTGALH